MFASLSCSLSLPSKKGYLGSPASFFVAALPGLRRGARAGGFLTASPRGERRCLSSASVMFLSRHGEGPQQAALPKRRALCSACSPVFTFGIQRKAAVPAGHPPANPGAARGWRGSPAWGFSPQVLSFGRSSPSHRAPAGTETKTPGL